MLLFSPKINKKEREKEEFAQARQNMALVAKTREMLNEVKKSYETQKKNFDLLLHEHFQEYQEKKDFYEGEIKNLEKKRAELLKPVDSLIESANIKKQEIETKEIELNAKFAHLTALEKQLTQTSQELDKMLQKLKMKQQDYDYNKKALDEQKKQHSINYARENRLIDTRIKKLSFQEIKLQKMQENIDIKEKILQKEKVALVEKEKQIVKKENMLNRWQQRLLAHKK